LLPYSRARRRDFEFRAGRASAAKTVIKVSSLTLPVFNPLVWNIMKRAASTPSTTSARRQDYPSISAFYAAFATGETDVHRRPHYPAKLYGKACRCGSSRPDTLADLVIFARTRNQVARRSQGQATCHRHGRLTIQVTKIYANGGIDLGRTSSP
jgi:hypothetical protein